MLQSLLVPVDGSQCSEESARLALALAERTSAEVVFLNVAYAQKLHYTGPSLDEHALYMKRGHELLDRFVRIARAKGVRAKKHLSERRNVPAGIVEACRELACDLIVIGTHAREGVERGLIGSVAEGVARGAPVPVLIVRYRSGPQTRGRSFEHLLVPVDGSHLSDLALDLAATLAADVRGKVDVLHVVPDLPLPRARSQAVLEEAEPLERDLRREGEALLRRAATRLGELCGKTILYDASGVRVGDVIARVAHDESEGMVVMGTHGRSGIDRLLLGSVAERVAHKAEQPVLLTREEMPRRR